jgi:hypothetical protein
MENATMGKWIGYQYDTMGEERRDFWASLKFARVLRKKQKTTP